MIGFKCNLSSNSQRRAQAFVHLMTHVTTKAMVMLLGSFLLCPAIASAKSIFSDDHSKASLNKLALEKTTERTAERTTADNDDGMEQTMRHNFSPEDRVRLRKSLAEYSKSTDPEHRQIEARRRDMRDSVKARFSACDKDLDDTIDRTETTECLPQVARHFNQVDINDDGVISLDELEEAQARIVERERVIEAKMEADKLRDLSIDSTLQSKRKAKQPDNSSRKRAL